MTELAIPLRWTLGSIYGVLITAAAVTKSLPHLRPGTDIAEVDLRVRTWWAMTIAFTVALMVGPMLSITLFAAIGLIAMREFLRLVGIRERTAAGVAFASIPVTYGIVGLGMYRLAWIAPIIMAIFVVPAALAISGRVDDIARNTGMTALAVLFTVWAPMHAVLLIAGPELAAPAGAAALLVFLVVCTEVNDVAQFLWGKAIGRTRITPTTSPNKTLAGLVGGIGTTTVVALVAGPVLTPLSAGAAALTGAGLAAMGFAGDLTMSAFKRNAGVKDTGSILPGHGGVLDRIDSLIYTAPTFAAVMVLT